QSRDAGARSQHDGSQADRHHCHSAGNQDVWCAAGGARGAMMAQRDAMSGRDGGVQGRGLVRVLVPAFAVALAAAGAWRPATAQQTWTPTVATAPGGTMRGPDPVPGALNREPTQIDPRYFPSPFNSSPP